VFDEIDVLKAQRKAARAAEEEEVEIVVDHVPPIPPVAAVGAEEVSGDDLICLLDDMENKDDKQD
jgi:hypothetical protein